MTTRGRKRNMVTISCIILLTTACSYGSDLWTDQDFIWTSPTEFNFKIWTGGILENKSGAEFEKARTEAIAKNVATSPRCQNGYVIDTEEERKENGGKYKYYWGHCL